MTSLLTPLCSVLHIYEKDFERDRRGTVEKCLAF